MSIRERNTHGLGHIPEDRHKHGLVLDYDLAYNTVLQSYFEKVPKSWFLKRAGDLQLCRRTDSVV